jgi:hypothetical protein
MTRKKMQSRDKLELERPIPHRIIIAFLRRRRLFHLPSPLVYQTQQTQQISLITRTKAHSLPYLLPESGTAPFFSPFRRFRLLRTSRERNTLYNNHPATQLGPYSPLVPPRSNNGRVRGPELRQISMIAQRWWSGRIWCQKNGGRVLGSARTLSRR